MHRIISMLNRMLHAKSRRESRVREIRTHGLVDEVNSLPVRRGFTLIERVSRKGKEVLDGCKSRHR